MEDIKNHAFFAGLDWDALQQRKVSPIFVPKVESNLDLSNIDRFFTKEEPKETPTDDSILLKSENFDQFTYAQKNDSVLANAGQNINTVDHATNDDHFDL